MGILIDSCVLIGLERSSRDVSDFISGRENEEFFISAISASELLHGVHRATNPACKARRSAFVEAVLAGFPIIDIDLPTARSHARLWSELQNQGVMIGLHDSWLAATCLAHDLRFVTANIREFERVPGLQLERWGD